MKSLTLILLWSSANKLVIRTDFD